MAFHIVYINSNDELDYRSLIVVCRLCREPKTPIITVLSVFLW